ncbi:Zn-ribbon domain-containing OB-fold protein [Stetteria hydrogenophila]
MRLSVPRHWRVKGPLYRLEAARCKGCGRIHYPPAAACPYCGSTSLERVRLSSRGVLESYTVVYSVPEGARHASPVVVGLVNLGGVRVVAELTDVEPGEVSTGMSVEAVLRKVREDGEAGFIYYAVKFRPALEAGRGE